MDNRQKKLNQCLGLLNGERCKEMLPKGKHFCKQCLKIKDSASGIDEFNLRTDGVVIRKGILSI
ncbi:MAG: hypothetical protein PHH17_02530 [Candidatus Pacebacteria bacterium]|jgi:hypothetical protein|nr:hypothetical protein [Candidatus Paceibacterota bacterium]MDD3072459.1 hypothetical protein [Candidatus Paceibacterota bacterium]MDD3729250.1 hypothetical protein [Candidatus Paceibacterota bacterium]MDD4201289.1 hypothetical protein [Candidatus Paceibacterota bacterium]MDD5446056.1 hypothetical protein [Candidatus Paceibacterota bacterium]